MKCDFLELLREGQSLRPPQSTPGAFRPRSLSAEEQESNSYHLHSQKASLQLPDFRLLLFHSVLCSLKGHLILFCFSLVPIECDL